MTTYNDLVNVPSFGKKRENFSQERGDIGFYCKDCHKVVEATRLDPVKYIYECPDCKGKNVSIGTIASLSDVYSKKRE